MSWGVRKKTRVSKETKKGTCSSSPIIWYKGGARAFCLIPKFESIFQKRNSLFPWVSFSFEGDGNEEYKKINLFCERLFKFRFLEVRNWKTAVCRHCLGKALASQGMFFRGRKCLFLSEYFSWISSFYLVNGNLSFQQLRQPKVSFWGLIHSFLLGFFIWNKKVNINNILNLLNITSETLLCGLHRDCQEYMVASQILSPRGEQLWHIY